MKPSANIEEKKQIDRLGQLVAKGLALSALQPTCSEITASDSPREDDPILSLFQKHQNLSVSEIKRLTGMKHSSAHRRLKRLLQEGKLITRGKARSTRYCLPIT